MSWDDLSMREKAAMMRVAVKNKIFKIDKIKEAYDSQDKQVSNSEVINPNQYTPSVNLNINPALDYVGNALESISGYEYEGNPLNKLGIDMSFDLGTTGSRMYPNGIKFVKKFDDGGFTWDRIKLEEGPVFPDRKVIDFSGNPIEGATTGYYYDGNPLTRSFLNSRFGENNYKLIKDDTGIYVEPIELLGTDVYGDVDVVYKPSDQIVERLKAKKEEQLQEQLNTYWDAPIKTKGGEFNLNQPSVMNHISTQVAKDTGTNFVDGYFTGVGESPIYYQNLRALDDRYNKLALSLVAPNFMWAWPAVSALSGTMAGNIIGNTAGSMAVGQTLEGIERYFMGESYGDKAVRQLIEWGINPFFAEMARPEYWINPTGAFTSKLTSKIGLVDPMKPFTHVGVGNSISRSKIHGRSYTPIDELKHFYNNKVAPLLDKNIDKLQVVHNPTLLIGNHKKVNNIDVPEVTTVKSPSSGYNGTVELAVPNSQTFTDRIYGKLPYLKAPKNTGQHYIQGYYDNSQSRALSVANSVLKGTAATDIAFNEDQDPLVRALEYGILGRGALKGVINSRLKAYTKIQNDYLKQLRNGIMLATDNLQGLKYTKQKLQSQSNSPMSSQIQTKSGININKAKFDDLVNFVNKGNYGRYYSDKFRVEDGTIVDSFGNIVASKGENGKINIHNDVQLRNLLQKDIDIIDYKTGKSYKGKIQVGDDGEVSIPQEYLDILQNNVDYVKNEVFPGSGIKVYGSSSGVLGAGFPHATHDIDYYITQDAMDKLLKEGKVKPSEMLTEDTYRHLLNNDAYGEQGWIDLNIIKKGNDGNAAGFRAEELYKQYFPDEYFEALRTAAAESANKRTSINVKIGRTPEELLEVMDPDTKSIMDSFDIDYTRAGKSKHKQRSWMHLVYSDPKKVQEAILQYAKSKLGRGAKSFPISTDKLQDVQQNIEALKLLGVKLEGRELNRIAKDPERMKAVLDAWYIMDRTPMRYVRGTWPGTTGSTADNYIKSATTWIADTSNGGNVMGRGLNTTIRGDSRWSGDIKAYIQPQQNYTETELLPLIEEINSKMGLTDQGKQQLRALPYDNAEAEKALYEIYSNEGKNFLSSLSSYGDGIYASGARPFTLPGDNIGFNTSQSIMHPITPRLNADFSQFKNVMESTRLVMQPTINLEQPFYSQNYINKLSDYLYNPDLRFKFRNAVDPRYDISGTTLGATAMGLILATKKYKDPYQLVDDNIDIFEHMNPEDKKKFSKDYIQYKEKQIAKGEKVRDIRKEIYRELQDILNKYTEVK